MIWSMACMWVDEQSTFWLGESSSWRCLQGACPALGWHGSAWAPAACQSRRPAPRRQRAQWWHQNGLPCAQTQAAWARRACTPPPAPCRPALTGPSCLQHSRSSHGKKAWRPNSILPDCILYQMQCTYHPGTLPSSASWRILGKVYLYPIYQGKLGSPTLKGGLTGSRKVCKVLPGAS